MTRSHLLLSRRERQIIDILYRKGQATAIEVQEGLPEPPSYSAVRAMLRVLESKGHIRHEKSGAKYVFIPLVNREKAKRSAIRHLIRTFFNDSPEQAVAALLDVATFKLPDAELKRLEAIIQKKQQGEKASIS